MSDLETMTQEAAVVMGIASQLKPCRTITTSRGACWHVLPDVREMHG
jgi:hypothetical protein